MREVLETVASL